METRTANIIAIVVGTAFLGFVAYRIYKYQQLKSGNAQKNDRKIKLVTN